MQFDFLTPERQLSLDDVPAVPLNPEYDTTDLLTESPEFKAALAEAGRTTRRHRHNAECRADRNRCRYVCDKCHASASVLYVQRGRLCGRCAYPEAYK